MFEERGRSGKKERDRKGETRLEEKMRETLGGTGARFEESCQNGLKGRMCMKQSVGIYLFNILRFI